jgi:hypothetical protein
MLDQTKNFSYGKIATAPSPASSGTSFVLNSGEGATFPDPASGQFNVIVWPVGVQPTATNAEVCRVTARSSDTFTIVRAQEGSSARTVIVGDQVMMAPSAQVFETLKYWKPVVPTITRVSDTQFTIPDASNAEKWDLALKKGVLLLWMQSTTFKVAMVSSSSYATNVVTVNLVGDAFAAGFGTVKYSVMPALMETFIIPGTIATGTDLAKTWHVPYDIYKIAALPFHKTAGTTNATTYDVNDDGTTVFTTKLSIATTATKGTLQVADAPTTVIAEDSLVTVDCDSVSTTAPVEAYIYLYYFPAFWRYMQ